MPPGPPPVETKRPGPARTRPKGFALDSGTGPVLLSEHVRKVQEDTRGNHDDDSAGPLGPTGSCRWEGLTRPNGRVGGRRSEADRTGGAAASRPAAAGRGDPAAGRGRGGRRGAVRRGRRAGEDAARGRPRRPGPGLGGGGGRG